MKNLKENIFLGKKFMAHELKRSKTQKKKLHWTFIETKRKEEKKNYGKKESRKQKII